MPFRTAWCSEHRWLSRIEAIHIIAPFDRYDRYDEPLWPADYTVVATVRLQCQHNVRVVGAARSLPDFYTELTSRGRKVKVINDD